MNRHSVFADVAGRPSRSTAGSPRVTASAVAFATADCEFLRSSLPPDMPKWRDSNASTAATAVEFVSRNALAIAVVSVNRDTDKWRLFLEDEAKLHGALASEARGPVGWVKAPVLLMLELLLRACTSANAHAIAIGPKQRLLDPSGLQLIECTVTCDTELSGTETQEIFRSFWEEDRVPNERLATLGYRIVHPSVSLKTEQEEPLLNLADVVAGLAHSALLRDPGRVTMPVSAEVSGRLMQQLQDTGKLFTHVTDFDSSYERIFGPTMNAVR